MEGVACCDQRNEPQHRSSGHSTYQVHRAAFTPVLGGRRSRWSQLLELC